MQIWSAEIKELEVLHTSLKGQLPDLEKELERLIKSDDENMVLLYSRRCLEVIITDLCEHELNRPRKTEPLKGIIDKLNREEKVPSHIIASMQSLNSLSTFGAHPKDFDPRQVKPVLNNLTTIIVWYQKYKNAGYEAIVDAPGSIEPEEIKKPVPVTKSKNKSVIYITGILFIVIIVVLVLDVFNIFRRGNALFDKAYENKRAIAILPFMNNTGDVKYNHWEYGISELLINALSTSDELIIIDNQTINEVIDNVENIQTASVGPEIANKVAAKLNVGSYIYGNYLLAGSTFRVNLKLIDTKSSEVLKTDYVEGTADSIFSMVGSLSDAIKNWLEIKLLGEDADIESAGYVTTTNPEAFRYFIQGMEAFWGRKGADEALLNAIRIDSTFTEAYFYISLAMSGGDFYTAAKAAMLKAYEGKDRVSRKMQLWMEAFMSQYVNKNPYESINYFKQVAEIDPMSRQNWLWLGLQYMEIEDNDNALPAFEQILKLNKQLGYWDTPIFYASLGSLYRQLGKYKKAHKILNEGLQYHPESSNILREQAIYALLQNDTTLANHYIKQYKSALQMRGNFPDPMITAYTGNIYRYAGLTGKAEELFRQALEVRLRSGPPIDTIQPGNNLFWYYTVLGYLFVENDIDVDEGVEHLKTALDLSKEGYPDHPLILSGLGYGYYKQGKYEEALRALKAAEEGTTLYNHTIYKRIQLVEKALTNQNK